MPNLFSLSLSLFFLSFSQSSLLSLLSLTLSLFHSLSVSLFFSLSLPLSLFSLSLSFCLSLSLEFRQKRICPDNLKGKTKAINCNVFNVYVKLFRKCNAMLRNKKASFFCASDFLAGRRNAEVLFCLLLYCCPLDQGFSTFSFSKLEHNETTNYIILCFYMRRKLFIE